VVEPKAFQDALLAYHARPCDPEAEAVRAAVLGEAWDVLDRLYAELEPGHPKRPGVSLAASTIAAMKRAAGVKVGATGREPELLQDCDRKLSRALANTPGARLHATEAAAAAGVGACDKAQPCAAPMACSGHDKCALAAPALTEEMVDAEALRWNLPGNDESLAFHRLPHSTQVMRAFKDGLRRGHALAAGVPVPNAPQPYQQRVLDALAGQEPVSVRIVPAGVKEDGNV